MALPQDLKNKLRKILGGFRAANGITAVPGGTGKALEAWVMMRLAKAACDDGNWAVSLRRGDGTRLPAKSVFIFPISQSGIQSANALASSYVLIEHKKNKSERLELHAGLQWRGRSLATHEIDVSAVPASIGEALRKGGGGLPQGLPVIAVECKDKTISGTPDEMRQTLARMFDLALVTKPWPYGACRTFEGVTGVTWGNWSSTYRAFFAKGTFAIARVGAFSYGAHQLAAHYYIQRIDGIYAANNLPMITLEGHFLNTLAMLGQL